MSSSSSSDNLFLLRKDQQAENLLLQSESTSSNSSQTQSTAQQEAEAESCENRSESKEQKKLKLKPEEKEDKEDDDDDDDGFRTPTSLDHRIPEAKQCPAAPRKPKPSLKRKANSSHTSFAPSLCRRNPPPLDLSLEVELLLFQPQHHNPLSDSRQNPKKSRTNECK